MSDKTSDKRYRITLTENQLALVGDAVELMMRTGMGQTYGLAEWLTLAGNDYQSGTDLFCLYVTERNLIMPTAGTPRKCSGSGRLFRLCASR